MQHLQPDSLGQQPRLLRELNLFFCLAPPPRCCRLPVGGAERVSTSPSSALIWLVLFYHSRCRLPVRGAADCGALPGGGPAVHSAQLDQVRPALRCAALQPGSGLGRLRPALVNRVEAGSRRQRGGRLRQAVSTMLLRIHGRTACHPSAQAVYNQFSAGSSESGSPPSTPLCTWEMLSRARWVQMDGAACLPALLGVHNSSGTTHAKCALGCPHFAAGRTLGSSSRVAHSNVCLPCCPAGAARIRVGDRQPHGPPGVVLPALSYASRRTQQLATVAACLPVMSGAHPLCLCLTTLFCSS